MTWLLAQIGLSLLLAAIAGWFAGWHLRAFRDQDHIEDLRQTMLVTEEIKDREINERRRQVEDLEMRLASASDARVQSTGTVASGAATVVEVSQGADRARVRESAIRVAPIAEMDPPATNPGAAAAEATALAAVVATERERRREADAALRRKTAALLTLQAEIEALREAVADKATKIAELQDRLVGTEPEGRELASTQAEVANLEARLRALDGERTTAIDSISTRDAELLESHKEVVIRDTRINDLRNRCASLETEVAAARETATSRGGEGLERLGDGLAEVRRALQRQIDRNRKQEVVHRAVVEQLESDKARLRAMPPLPTPLPAADGPVPGDWRGLPAKRSDELAEISGVGPAFAKAMREAGIDTYAQIAAWNDSDIERYATAVGAHAKRIRTDRWVEQARELARTSRAHCD